MVFILPRAPVQQIVRAAMEVRPAVYTVTPPVTPNAASSAPSPTFSNQPPAFGDNLALTLVFQYRKKVADLMPRVKEEEQNTHRTMQVVNHVRSLIENGTLQPGDKIPPEREFARSLKISRASLRTGIGYLAAMGVMKVRHGVGTFVADGPPQFGTASLSLIGALHGFQSWQMFEARIILESHLAALAAERGKQEQFAALAEEVAEMFASMNSPTDYLIHDLLFHRIVSQASGNPILAAIIETITSALYDTRRKTVERSTDMRESAEMHREIYRAIRGRNSKEAHNLMEKHLCMAQIAQGMERPTGRRKSLGPFRKRQVRSASAA
jgi:GntR family transcriptional repressor for pyruvate dehydrogenase complex